MTDRSDFTHTHVIFLVVFIEKYCWEQSFWFTETGLSQFWRAILSCLGAFCKCLASALGRMDGFSVLTWMRLTYSNLVSHGHAFCFQDHLPDSRRSGFCKAALRQEIFCISQEEIWGKTVVLPALLVLFNWCGISGRLDAWGLQD